MSDDISFDITKIFDTQNKIMLIAFIFGIIFLCLGIYNLGYNNGYNYVKEYKDNYIDRYCTCEEDYIVESYEHYNIIKEKNNSIII